MATDDGFLSRWSRRKTQVTRGEAPPPEADVPLPTPPAQPAAETDATATTVAPVADADVDAVEPPDPPPTLQDAEALTPQADFSRFVKRDVDDQVRNTALKKLFADPHYNVMDGLDIYIGDYNTPDPLPPSMLRQMVQSQFLGLFTDDPETPPAPTAPADTLPAAPTPDAAPAATAPPAQALPDEDPDLRLQPDDAAGRAEPLPGAGEDGRREP